jgi:hypothetical protein
MTNVQKHYNTERAETDHTDAHARHWIDFDQIQETLHQVDVGSLDLFGVRRLFIVAVQTCSDNTHEMGIGPIRPGTMILTYLFGGEGKPGGEGQPEVNFFTKQRNYFWYSKSKGWLITINIVKGSTAMMKPDSEDLPHDLHVTNALQIECLEKLKLFCGNEEWLKLVPISLSTSEHAQRTFSLRCLRHYTNNEHATMEICRHGFITRTLLEFPAIMEEYKNKERWTLIKKFAN